MISTILYLLKCSAYVIAFYIPFVLFFRRTTFFTINRLYLVSGLLLSFVLPLYAGYRVISSYPIPDIPLLEPIVTQAESAIFLARESGRFLNVTLLIIIFYFMGVVVRLIMLMFSIRDIFKLKQNNDFFLYHGVRFFKANVSVPFSFFNYVVMPKNIDDAAILEHEAVHVWQYHWIDLLVAEIVSIILWFNPVVIIYRRSLKQQHEYLADQTAIRNGIDISDYLVSIKKHIELTNLHPLTNQFYFHSIKNRIDMLTEKRTSVLRLAAYGAVLPLIICLLMAFSSRRHLHVIIADGNDSTQQLVLGLPISKKNIFLLESGYGERLHPVFQVMRLHTGIDLTAKEGVPVISAQNGTVIKAQVDGAWGNIIVVQHDDTYATSYSHLKFMNVKEGDHVQKGDEIGLVGHTGLSSTKDHLHFELLKNGVAIDPIKYLPEIK